MTESHRTYINHSKENQNMSTAAERIAALKAAHAPKPKSNGSNNSYYPFYRMNYDESTTIRFLPDANPNNPLVFMFEKLTHQVEGADGKPVTVPCLRMYGEDNCPVCKKAAEFYKADGKESKNGKALYVKRAYLTQAIVVKDPLPYKEGEVPATGQVRIVSISPSVYQKIQAAFADDDLRNSPEDYEKGTDFLIKKTKKGEYANYDNSKFLRDERALTPAELSAIEGKLVDLSTLRPAKPEVHDLEAFVQSFLNGTLSSGIAAPSAGSGSSGSNVNSAYNKPAGNPNEYLSQQSASPTSQPTTSGDDDPDAEAQRILNDILTRRS